MPTFIFVRHIYVYWSLHYDILLFFVPIFVPQPSERSLFFFFSPQLIVDLSKQADHLRQETLQQMSRILTTRQAARGLLAMGEYFQRLWALSSLWATRPREPA